jgi:hypothetical protein
MSVVRTATREEAESVGTVKARRSVVGLDQDGRIVVQCDDVLEAFVHPWVAFIYQPKAPCPLLKVLG